MDGFFSINHRQTEIFNDVAVGSYTVTEDDPTGSGWALAGINCVDPYNGTTFDISTRTVTSTLIPTNS